MKKIALMVLVAAFAATPAMAASKKKAKKMHAAPAAQTANPNEAGWRLTRDAFPIVLPGWAMPIYLAAQKNEAGNKK
jgi:hypothetical protein